MKQILARDALPFIFMADVDVNVLDVGTLWNRFSSNDYWRRNYNKLHAEDQEVICRLSHFLAAAFADRAPAQRAIDVGSGTNLYHALPILPWTERILLTDYLESNASWLQDQLVDDTKPWSWLPFWWDLGTMFFVAESITREPRVVLAAPAFMAGSGGYEVGGRVFPTVPITRDDVEKYLTELSVREANVELLETKHEVHDGYTGMIVATGFASNRRLGRGS